MQREVRKLSKENIDLFKNVLQVFESVFELQHYTMPEDAYLQSLLSKEDFFVFAALLNGQVVGGLTAYLFPQYYSPQPLVYVYDLAVSTTYQRQGIGRELMNAVFEAVTGVGAEEVFVQADEEDDHALKFYQSLNGGMEEVRHFTFSLPRP
jgi:aminoglycoside 3-N-acetyltransferase I